MQDRGQCVGDPDILIDAIHKHAELFYKYLFDNHLPSLVTCPEYSDTSPQLKEGDIVYNRQDDCGMSKRWTAGEVVQAKAGGDGNVREVVI